MAKDTIPKVRFTWNISYDCNYRCSYCFFEGRWQDYKKRNVYLSVDEWVKYWDQIVGKYGPIFLIITGGEPFLYPDFIELIKRLSGSFCHINISTNSSIGLERFVKEIDPGRVSVSPSFQREFSTLDQYIEKVKLIRKHNFKGCLNLVAYPPFLGQIESDNKKLFEETGEKFKIIPFFGKYLGIEYPQGYTQEARQAIGINDAWFDQVKRRGSMCSAGFTSALIFPEGKVARCGQIGERLLLGSFFDPGFKLYDKPMLCDAEYCPCQEDSVDGSAEEDLRKGSEPEPLVGGITDTPEELLKINKELSSSNGKINFAWDIHYRCNFRCPYCWFFDNWAQQSRRNLYLAPDAWMKHWLRIFDRYGEVKIAITGGEPFLYPNFIPLVKQLSQIHSVKITTNMSGDIETFVKEIDPQKVILDLNFHPLFSTLDTYIKKVLLLKRAGFKAGVCYLAYPPQMKQINAVRKRFESEGINFALAAFWGEYLGRRYPESYSQEDRDMIRPFLGDIDRITYHLKGESPKGKLCNAGHKYAVIQADGKVIRCGPLADGILGSIFDENFRMLEAPTPCTAEYCPCNEYINLVEAKE